MSDRKTQRAVYRNNDRKKVVKKLYEEEIALLKDRVSVLNAELSKLQNISSSITWNGSYCTRCQKWWTKPAYLKTHKCWPGHEEKSPNTRCEACDQTLGSRSSYNRHRQRQSCKKTREQAAEKKLKDVTLDALDLDESENSMSFNLDRAHNAESAANLHDEIAAYMVLPYAATSHSSVADHDVAFNDQNRSSSSMSRISDRSTVFADEGQLSRQNPLEMHNLGNQRTEYSAVHNPAFADEGQLFRQNPLGMHNLEDQRTGYSVHDANFENGGQITIPTDQSTSYSTLYDPGYMGQGQGQTTNPTDQSISYFALYDPDYVDQGQGSNDTPQLWGIGVWEGEWLV